MEEKSNSKYCYENGVLINKLGIQDLDLLHKTERNYTTFRISELECGKKKINVFGVNGYLELHKLIFLIFIHLLVRFEMKLFISQILPMLRGRHHFVILLLFIKI